MFCLLGDWFACWLVGLFVRVGLFTCPSVRLLVCLCSLLCSGMFVVNFLFYLLCCLLWQRKSETRKSKTRGGEGGEGGEGE